MSVEDYDECENMFCGTWTLSTVENVEEFMTASEMLEEEKRFNRKLEGFTCIRIGDVFHIKLLVRGVEYDIPTTIGEELEWNPNWMVHYKLFVTFKDGVWREEVTSLKEDGGKKYVWSFYRNGEDVITELSIPDVPGVTAKQTFKKA